MKPCSAIPAILTAALTAFSPVASEAADPEPTIESLGVSSFRYDWEGEAGWTYFIQWSLDLASWSYFPVIDQGEEHDPFEFSSTAPRMFLRLVLSDISTTDPFLADFDSDGLSNIFELMHGLDPFGDDTDGDLVTDGAEDEDLDGSLNTSEELAGRDPTVKDHPAVKLSVVVGH